MTETTLIPPGVLPPQWAGEFGEDDFGVFASRTLEGVAFPFRWIPPGEFVMGEEESAHPVRLTAGFWMLETPVTQGQWMALAEKNPSHFKGEEKPVETVSWRDGENWLKTLKGHFGEMVPRFPSEAEWEYACRAGTTTRYALGDTLGSDQANFNGKFPDGAPKGPDLRETSPVGKYEPNRWGLRDMHGNVREWCQDWYGKYREGFEEDPQGPPHGSGRVLRGGGWFSVARFCRSAFRYGSEPDDRNFSIGFRFVLQASSEQAVRSPEL